MTLVFIDTSVLVNIKRLIVQAKMENNKTEDAPKPQTINPAMFDHIELPDLVITGLLTLFQKLGISSMFMEENPEAWRLCDDFCEALKVVNALAVTNYHAERGIELIEKYNSILTHSEKQKQYLSQMVSKHRKKFPNCKKSTLTLKN